MTNITIDLEHGMKLKERGRDKPTIFRWSKKYYGEIVFGKGKESYDGEYRVVQYGPMHCKDTDQPAPTTDELLEKLPGIIAYRENEMIKGFTVFELQIVKFPKEYGARYISNGDFLLGYHSNGELLPNALADLRCWLKDKGYIE